MAETPAKSASGGGVPLDYLLIGHVTVDRLEGAPATSRRLPLGGTATYAALAAQQLGARVGIHTSASYEPGLIELLHKTMVARIPAEYTTCFVNEYPDGQRRQTIESLAERLTYEQLLPEWRNPPVVHLAPVCQELDAALVDRFPRSLVCVTPQGWLRAWDDAGVVRPTDWADAERVLGRADAVVVSAEDVGDAGMIDRWAAQARLLVVTRGEAGCDVYCQGEPGPHHSSAFKPTGVVDPTGAGDVFAAAFFWHLRQSDGDWREAADWANCVASFAVEKRGTAGVPKLEDVEKRWRGGVRIGAT